MAKNFRIDPDHWTKLAPASGENADLVLSSTDARAVSHAQGSHGDRNWVVLRQLASDPSDPYTAGKMIFTAHTVTFIDGSSVDVAHSDDYPRDELALAFDQAAAHTIHSGGFYVPGYRVPLEWRLVLQAGTPNNHIEIEMFRQDGAVIDADDRTDVSLTIDIDTDDTSTADIAITDAVATPAGNRGGGIIRATLTDAQLLLLRPVDGDGNRTYNKIGVTIGAASSTPVQTYSAFAETHPDTTVWDKKLAYGETVFLKAPSSGAWYARLRSGDHKKYATLFVGD